MTKKYRVLDGDVDLEREDVRDSQNRRIDADYVERAVADVYARRGRRPLTDDTPTGQHSPRVSFEYPNRPAAALKNAPAPKDDQYPILPAKRWSAISRPDRLLAA